MRDDPQRTSALLVYKPPGNPSRNVQLASKQNLEKNKKKSLRELVKTILHARDPLFGGQGKEETIGLSSWVGGYMREHGSLKLGGGIYERTWVSQAGWGDI